MNSTSGSRLQLRITVGEKIEINWRQFKAPGNDISFFYLHIRIPQSMLYLIWCTFWSCFDHRVFQMLVNNWL